MSAVIARKRILISGIVQGIGFRPFVYRLAQRFGIRGSVLNTSEGVLVEVEGGHDSLERFLQALTNEHPPHASIRSMEVTDLEPAGLSGFIIRDSVSDENQFVLVSPDLATCDDCRRECADPSNRRFGYPFTNCTNCGPRYSIIRDIPYDRPLTTMASFAMCPDCQAEYDDPGDRRFHAQPNACPVCGPSLSMVLDEARRLLAAGQIVAIKGLGGFHLACDAENDAAVCRLRERKRRSDKPFALMAPDVAVIEEFCFVSADERQALLSAQRPIVILPRRPDASVSAAVAPGNNTLGVMLPCTPLHHLLFANAAYRILVMTSGNLSEEPIVIDNHDARARLARVADQFVLHNRDIYMRVDDSVVRTFEGRTRVLRRSRGYAPGPIDLGMEAVEVLACGAELKNTFCLTKGRYALLSQHIGDLESYETLQFFEETLEQMKKLFRVEPRIVTHDLHPNYLGTRFAQQIDGVERIGVQHHHAHIAACMTENGIRDKVIGVAFDGTGYGTDGKIWGGEFLIADLATFERRAHLRYVPLSGGDQAIRQPWRMALSYLIDTFGTADSWRDLPVPQSPVVETMIRRNVNTVETSSCGRLCDAVASILGLRHEVTFEAQAAIDLEMIACEGIEDCYPFDVISGNPWQLDLRPAIREIVDHVLHGVQPAVISARFHNTIATLIADVCVRLRKEELLNRVCLSGGTFQNMYLLSRSLTCLRRAGFEIFLHSQVPCNDGGVSLGQAAIVNHLATR